MDTGWSVFLKQNNAPAMIFHKSISATHLLFMCAPVLRGAALLCVASHMLVFNQTYLIPYNPNIWPPTYVHIYIYISQIKTTKINHSCCLKVK